MGGENGGASSQGCSNETARKETAIRIFVQIFKRRKEVRRLRPGHSFCDTQCWAQGYRLGEYCEGTRGLGRREGQFRRPRRPSWDSVPELMGRDSLLSVISVAAASRGLMA